MSACNARHSQISIRAPIAGQTDENHPKFRPLDQKELRKDTGVIAEEAVTLDTLAMFELSEREMARRRGVTTETASKMFDVLRMFVTMAKEIWQGFEKREES